MVILETLANGGAKNKTSNDIAAPPSKETTTLSLGLLPNKAAAPPQ